jgi:hypothetical protein
MTSRLRVVADTRPASVGEEARLCVQRQGEGWRQVGAGAERLVLINEFLGYLEDRNYSPRTVRAYAFDLLHFGTLAARPTGRPRWRDE